MASLRKEVEIKRIVYWLKSFVEAVISIKRRKMASMCSWQTVRGGLNVPSAEKRAG